MMGHGCCDGVASKLYGVNATIIIFVFVLYCIVLYGGVRSGWMIVW